MSLQRAFGFPQQSASAWAAVFNGGSHVRVIPSLSAVRMSHTFRGPRPFGSYRTPADQYTGTGYR